MKVRRRDRLIGIALAVLQLGVFAGVLIVISGLSALAEEKKEQEFKEAIFSDKYQVGYYENLESKNAKFYTLPLLGFEKIRNSYPKLILPAPRSVLKWEKQKPINVAIKVPAAYWGMNENSSVGEKEDVKAVAQMLQALKEKIKNDTDLEIQIHVFEGPQRNLDAQQQLNEADIVYILSQGSNSSELSPLNPKPTVVFPVIRIGDSNIGENFFKGYILLRKNEIKKAVCDFPNINANSISLCLYRALGLVSLERDVSSDIRESFLKALYKKNIQAGMTEKEVESLN